MVIIVVIMVVIGDYCGRNCGHNECDNGGNNNIVDCVAVIMVVTIWLSNTID